MLVISWCSCLCWKWHLIHRFHDRRILQSAKGDQNLTCSWHFCCVWVTFLLFPPKVIVIRRWIFAYKMPAVPPTYLCSGSSSRLLSYSKWITLPGGSTWEPPLWQHKSCLASGLQVELTSQESGAGFDTSKGITQGHFVLHSNCRLGRERAKCHARPGKQKVRGSRVSPLPLAHVLDIPVTTVIWW